MRKRVFNYTEPIVYQGSVYPSTQMDIEDDKGNVVNRNVFVDTDGQYYSLNINGRVIPIILQNNLDEITVTAPKRETKTLTGFEQGVMDYCNNQLIDNSDNTIVLNRPHREYNPHLKERAKRGAESNALWEKEHPIATVWGQTASAIPFAVAATPFALAAGEALVGTELGQGITNGLGLVANAASNNTLLPWLDATATSYFGAHGLQDVQNGNVMPETVFDMMPLTRVAKPIYKVGKELSETRSWLNGKPKFVSELDWSPESWFGTRVNGKYDAEDVVALKSHLPEYYQIEQQTKADGTWLKMPDGSTWKGDPRSWVQLMSKDGKKLQKRIMYHGDDKFYTWENGEDITPETLGNIVLWTSNNKHLPQTYGSNHYQLTIPKETPNVAFDAEGRSWNDLSTSSNKKYHNTNDVSSDLLRSNNTVNINNVVYVGTSLKWKAGENGLPKALSGERLYDYCERVFKGDDIVLYFYEKALFCFKVAK